MILPLMIMLKSILSLNSIWNFIYSVRIRNGLKDINTTMNIITFKIKKTIWVPALKQIWLNLKPVKPASQAIQVWQNTNS